MSTYGKRKGAKHEINLRDYAKSRGHEFAERIQSEGVKDRGDVINVRDRDGQLWTFQAKATRANDLAGAIKDSAQQAVHAGATRYVVIKHLNRHSIQDDLACLPVWLLFDLIDGTVTKELP